VDDENVDGLHATRMSGWPPRALRVVEPLHVRLLHRADVRPREFAANGSHDVGVGKAAARAYCRAPLGHARRTWTACVCAALPMPVRTRAVPRAAPLVRSSIMSAASANHRPSFAPSPRSLSQVCWHLGAPGPVRCQNWAGASCSAACANAALDSSEGEVQHDARVVLAHAGL
jgi:hypothetical protein